MGSFNKIIGTSLALASLGLAGAPVQAASNDQWQGFYLGAAAGNREQQIDWEQRDVSFPDADASYYGEFRGVNGSSKSNNGYFALYGGYNWLVSERTLLGLELAAGYANSQSEKNRLDFTNGLFPSETTTRIQADWDASLRGRAGYLITPSLLVYGAAGLAATRLESSTDCPSDGYVCSPFSAARSENHNETVWGWTAGLGLEASLSEHLLARAEYQYTDYESTSFDAMSQETYEAFGVKSEVDSRSQKLTLGLAYRF
jgi:outer membrane immunogenic protein